MPTLAERLGFDASDRIAVVHADDIGMSHAANVGAFEALENGPATCGSIMVPCPWFQEAADHAKAHPELDLGVHLVLNAEWGHYRWGPVAGRSAVPSLLDDQGFLPRTTAETAQRAKPEEVEVELRAQIDAALAAGVDVTHIDSHMGTCFYPQFVEIYARLAVEYRVPVFAVRPSQEAIERNPLGTGVSKLVEAVDAAESKGVPILDLFDADSLGFPKGEGVAHNEKRIAGLKTGINYLICHPAKGGPELAHICPESDHQRDFERSFYGGAAGQAALDAAGVKTVGMRPLRDLMRGA